MKLFSSLKSLEDALRKCPKISIAGERKDVLKKQIMAVVKHARQAAEDFHEEQGFKGLIEKIREFALQIIPDRYFQTLLKEKLVMLVSFQFSKGRSWADFFGRMASKKVFAGVIAAVFVFTVLFNFTFRIERVEASSVTLLESFSGNVTIIREGGEIAASNGFFFKADDTIRTGPSSSAAIRFMDQSVSRLDENTEVKISKLFINPLNKTQTVVELILNRGQMWSRVINLIDNFSRFQVKAENTLAVAKRKAAFNVSVSPKKQATVAAIQNRVDLVVATDKKVMETTLVKGFSAEINTSTLPSAPQITPEKAPEPENTWVADNLAEDKIYIENVKQEMKDQLRDQVKVMPGNPLYAVKELSEGAKIGLTFDELGRMKKIFITVEWYLAEAQLFLERGEQEKAGQALEKFKAELQDVLEWVKQFEVSHPLEAAEFRAQVISILSSYEKKLSIILPNDALYSLKSTVAEVNVIAAENTVSRIEKKLSQAGDKLLEANDLMEQGDVPGAVEQVEAYTGAVSEVVLEVRQMPGDEKEKAVSALLDTKMEDLKMLEALKASESSLPSEPSVPPDVPAPPTLPELALPDVSAPPTLPSPALPDVPAPPTLPSPALSDVPAPTTLPEPALPDVPAPTDLPGPSPSVVPAPVIPPASTLTPTIAPPTKDFQQTLADAKSVTFEQLSEAVQEVQKNQPSAEVLQKLQNIKELDVNGKPLVNVTLSKDKVFITPPRGGSKIQVSPPARP